MSHDAFQEYLEAKIESARDSGERHLYEDALTVLDEYMGEAA